MSVTTLRRSVAAALVAAGLVLAAAGKAPAHTIDSPRDPHSNLPGVVSPRDVASGQLGVVSPRDMATGQPAVTAPRDVNTGLANG